MRRFIQLIVCSTFCYLYFPALLVSSQMTLPSMVTIPPDSEPATMNTSSTYAMTIYDQACLDQAEPASSNQTSSGNSSSSSNDDDDLSQWVQSQFVVYVGAVALNSNNTCQVVCQVQSLMSFAIMFGQDIRTRSVLIGRVYMTSMPDGTTCVSDSNNGTCSSGVCGAGGGNETTTESSASSESSGTTVAGGSTTLSSGTTVSGASAATTVAGGSTTGASATTAAATTAATTAAPSG